MDIYALTIAQILSYGLMFVLLARAMAHGFEAHAEARRLRPVIRSLEEVGSALRDGLVPGRALAQAQAAVEGTSLCELFRMSARLTAGGGIHDQIQRPTEHLHDNQK